MWEAIANWLVAIGTLVLAFVAVFQEKIRAWFYRPQLRVSVQTAPPDCVMVPMTTTTGQFLCDSVYLRLRVENFGNATARNAEVHAKRLRRERADGTWDTITAFPPMNLKWANTSWIFFPFIAPDMDKHCDIAHVVDPGARLQTNEENPVLKLAPQRTSLSFDLMVAPNHKGHIVGPGDYELDILVGAENARPKKYVVTISLKGPWYPNEDLMLRDGVGVTVRDA